MLQDKRLLIVEDEMLIAEHLKAILTELKCEMIELAYNKENAMTALDTFKPDIVLLDIHLEKKTDGIELAAYINSTTKIPFIFITAYSDTHILGNALQKHPAAYITKPFKQTDVLAAIQLVFINNPELSKEYLSFKNGTETVRLHTNTILFIESSGNYIYIHTTGKKYTLRCPLSWAAENLPQNNFVKVHRAYIVNVNHISELAAQYLIINNTTISISRLYKENLLDRYQSL